MSWLKDERTGVVILALLGLALAVWTEPFVRWSFRVYGFVSTERQVRGFVIAYRLCGLAVLVFAVWLWLTPEVLYG